MANPTMNLLLEHLDSLEWKYELSDDYRKLRFSINLEGGKVDCLAAVNYERDFVIFFSILPVFVPLTRRNAIAEAICRANYGLNMGNFEMDYRDGELRYRTFANTDLGAVNADIIRHLIHANLEMMNRYMMALMGVAFGDQDPAEAIARVESKSGSAQDN